MVQTPRGPVDRLAEHHAQAIAEIEEEALGEGLRRSGRLPVPQAAVVASAPLVKVTLGERVRNAFEVATGLHAANPQRRSHTAEGKREQRARRKERGS